jgi:hypothetical protein
MNWLKQLFTRHRHYDELSESIREHLEEKIADLMDNGSHRSGNGDAADNGIPGVFGWLSFFLKHAAKNQVHGSLTRLRPGTKNVEIALRTAASGGSCAEICR